MAPTLVALGLLVNSVELLVVSPTDGGGIVVVGD
jgi:hypothetical protein